MPKTPWSTNSMQIRLRIPGEIEVDDDIDSLDIDASGAEIRRDEAPALTLSETVENVITLLLTHFGVDEIAWVSKLDDFLSEELDSHSGITEYNGLCYIQFTE